MKMKKHNISPFTYSCIEKSSASHRAVDYIHCRTGFDYFHLILRCPVVLLVAYKFQKEGNC